MKIGIIGAGNVGSALATVFRRLGHAVQIANSRGPETLAGVADRTGAVPVSILDVAKGADLLVIAVPEKNVPSLPQKLFRELPLQSPIIDTGNYYPFRDGTIDEIENGLSESEWVSNVLGRPVIKVFNNVFTENLIHSGLPKGAQDRIALPVAGDDSEAKAQVIALVESMGFDGIDAGTLHESWRQQPGTPVYATNHDADTLGKELGKTDRAAAPQMRDGLMKTFMSLPPGTKPGEMVGIARSMWAEKRAS